MRKSYITTKDSCCPIMHIPLSGSWDGRAVMQEYLLDCFQMGCKTTKAYLRPPRTSQIEGFVTRVNGKKLSAIVAKRSILNVCRVKVAPPNYVKFVVLMLVTLRFTFKSQLQKNGQTNSNNLSANCWRIVWVCLIIFWVWSLNG